ncbi:hypothetical protein CFC35_14265 [Streptomyces sp. FBKL.4005]|nr:hypothetical protein CFC35_14265 [Streptomyces sp. FBKL.4005]
MPVLAWPMTSVPERATGSVISWMGKGVMMPTASRASAVSGRIPSSRNVVVRVLPLLCARCEASAGVMSDRAGDVGCRTDQPLGASRMTRDLCRRSSARTAEGPSCRRTITAVRPWRAVGSEPIGPPTGHPHACGLSGHVEHRRRTLAGALPPYPGFAHMRWPIWSRSRGHSDRPGT